MAEDKSIVHDLELLEKCLKTFLTTGNPKKDEKIPDYTKKALQFYSILTGFIGSMESLYPKDSTVCRTTSPITYYSVDDAKKAVICSREKCLDFNAKDIVSIEGKGKEGTRFNDPSYLDILSQEKLDLISATFGTQKEYSKLLSVMYINRFCCEEKKEGNFTWKEVTSNGETVYTKKTKEEVKDILSLYTVEGKDAYTFYMDSLNELRLVN